MSEITIEAQSLSELFYTIDTYGTFDIGEYFTDQWFEESDYDRDGFMKDLGELHASVINSVLPAGPVKSVKFLETSSPNFYNFSTDQADLAITVDIDGLLEFAHKHENALEIFLKENFTSYSGFMSWTPNNLKDFYESIAGTSFEFSRDKDKCIAILTGWYLTETETLTHEEYMDEMFDEFNQVCWDNFEQFLPETWESYNEYVDNFNIEQSHVEMVCPNMPPRPQYPMEIEEWFKDREEAKEKEEVNA